MLNWDKSGLDASSLYFSDASDTAGMKALLEEFQRTDPIAILEKIERNDPLAILKKCQRTDPLEMLKAAQEEVRRVQDLTLSSRIEEIHRSLLEAIEKFDRAVKHAQSHGIGAEFRRARRLLRNTHSAFRTLIRHEHLGRLSVPELKQFPTKRDGGVFFHASKVDGRNLP